MNSEFIATVAVRLKPHSYLHPTYTHTKRARKTQSVGAVNQLKRIVLVNRIFRNSAENTDRKNYSYSFVNAKMTRSGNSAGTS